MKINCIEIRDKMLKNINLNGRKCAIIQVGNREDSNRYIKNKIKTIESVGGKAELIKLDENVSVGMIMGTIIALNGRDDVSGIILQLPLPNHLKDRESDIIRFISPSKDIDCITPENEQKIYQGNFDILPCTVSACIKILEEHLGVDDFSGKSILVLGRSRIVGKPLTMALLHKNATITVAHSKTKDLDDIIRKHNIIISAVGKRGLLNIGNISPNSIIIDVGINFDENGKLCGDLDKSMYDCEIDYTPVPSGVGQLTTTYVAYNLLKLGE